MKREELIKVRKSLGLTQAEMAAATGVHRSYYGLIENGNRNPTLKIAAKIATALNSSIEQLFPDEIFFANKCYEMKLQAIYMIVSMGGEKENGKYSSKNELQRIL